MFFAYPVASIIGRGLAPGGHVDLSPLSDVFTDRGLRGIVWFTLWQAALSTVLTVLVALPGAYVLARYEFRGKRLVRALVTVPFVLPTVVVGSAFLALGVGPSVSAILLAHVFFNYAVVVRTVGGLWAHLDPRQEEAARVLGASRARVLREVTLPALRPAITAAAIDHLPLHLHVLRRDPDSRRPDASRTLETEIYRQTTQLLDLHLAAALSIVQLAAVVAAPRLHRALRGPARDRARLAPCGRGRPPAAQRARARRRRRQPRVHGRAARDPIAVLVARSFDTPGGASFDFYRALGTVHAGSVLFVPPTDAIRNSLVYAAIATAIALSIGGLAAFALAARVAIGAVRRRPPERSRSASRRSPSASASSSRSTRHPSTCARRRCSCRSRRRSSRSRSSCASW